jgi:hypothetical protein
MFGHLLDDFAMAELVQLTGDNRPHVCTAQSTANSGLTWTNMSGGTDLPCRLSRPQVQARDRSPGGVAVSASAPWILALEPGSQFAGPWIRYLVTGEEHGEEFSRTLYSIAALTPIAQNAEARVACQEEPLQVAGS